jgi:flavin reductase (DIM6/NTAB) family NADH-FMN oxidoreductase RutF
MAKVEVALETSYRLLEPGPITLVTSQYRGQPDVMAAAWVVPVSHRPPMLVAAISPLHNTHFLISKSQEFVVNVPGRPLADQVMIAGTCSGRDVDDKFARAGLTAVDGRRVTVPWVDECLAHLECGLVDAYQAGDHTLFLGEVIGAWAEEEAFDEFWRLESEELSPLQHLGARHFALLGGRFTVREAEEA